MDSGKQTEQQKAEQKPAVDTVAAKAPAASPAAPKSTAAEPMGIRKAWNNLVEKHAKLMEPENKDTGAKSSGQQEKEMEEFRKALDLLLKLLGGLLGILFKAGKIMLSGPAEWLHNKHKSKEAVTTGDAKEFAERMSNEPGFFKDLKNAVKKAESPAPKPASKNSEKEDEKQESNKDKKEKDKNGRLAEKTDQELNDKQPTLLGAPKPNKGDKPKAPISQENTPSPTATLPTLPTKMKH